MKIRTWCLSPPVWAAERAPAAPPIVAEVAKERDILTIGVVTRPFDFEGSARRLQAEAGIEEMRSKVDALIVIPNERLKLVSEQRITFKNAFEIADNVLRQAIQSISELITMEGIINSTLRT